jgi:hypothetical protein
MWAREVEFLIQKKKGEIEGVADERNSAKTRKFEWKI